MICIFIGDMTCIAWFTHDVEVDSKCKLTGPTEPNQTFSDKLGLVLRDLSVETPRCTKLIGKGLNSP